MEDTYKNQLQIKAGSLNPASFLPVTGAVGWACPSNIAIIKYWGKRSFQLPQNPSLSMTLQESVTRTHVKYSFDPVLRNPEIRFLFEKKDVPGFRDRIEKFIRGVIPFIPVLAHTAMHIESENTFPHSSGIASSASAMGALATCLVQMEEEILGISDPISFEKKVSFIARQGSGSASRSIYPNLALWGASPDWAGSSDEYAIPVTEFHNTFKRMRDSILIVESGQKKIPSTAGHALMDSNPFAEIRFKQARENLAPLKKVLKEGDWDRFIDLLEEEALTLHAMMMTGKPGYLLMQPGTISIIHKVREFRRETRCRIGFTLDAGANVHLMHGEDEADEVEEFVVSELLALCENGGVIRDRMGKGPEKLKSWTI